MADSMQDMGMSLLNNLVSGESDEHKLTMTMAEGLVDKSLIIAASDANARDMDSVERAHKLWDTTDDKDSPFAKIWEELGGIFTEKIRERKSR